MKKQDRREFIKIAGKTLLITSGISVFGLVTAKPKNEGEETKEQYFADGYYDDGYYDDGYYDDGYYDDGYYHDGYGTGIGQIRKDALRLVIAPNPSDGNFELMLNAKNAEHSTILINDLTGKTLVRKIHVLQQGSNRVQFQSESLPKGMYELKVVTEKGEGSIRLVIVK